MSKPTHYDSPPADSAVDLTTCFAADSMLVEHLPPDPWRERCTSTLVDLIVNKPSCVFPLPPGASRSSSSDLPLSCEALSQEGLLAAIETVDTNDAEPTDEELVGHFHEFSEFVSAETAQLQAWLSLHFTPVVREKHVTRISGTVQDSTLDFWRGSRLPRDLAQRCQLRDEELQYAFDVMKRGRQYYKALVGRSYYPHPLRAPLFTNSTLPQQEQVSWSWGNAIVNLLRTKRLPRGAGPLASLVANLQAAVRSNQVTPSEAHGLSAKQLHERLMSAASFAGLPVSLAEEVKHRLESAAVLASAGALLLRAHNAYVDVVHAGHIALHFWDGAVPQQVSSIPIFRGVLTVPGLYRSDALYLPDEAR